MGLDLFLLLHFHRIVFTSVKCGYLTGSHANIANLCRMIVRHGYRGVSTEKITEEFLFVRLGTISNDVNFSEVQASPTGED